MTSCLKKDTTRDASDLSLFLTNYLDIANHRDALFEQHDDLLVEGFDYEQAGARLLGRDIAAMAGSETKAKVLEVLATETAGDSYRLAQQMRGSDRNRSLTEYTALLDALEQGMKD